MSGDPIDPRYNGLRTWDAANEPECCSPALAITPLAPCSELAEHEKRDVRSYVDSFLRSFPMSDADGSWRKDATRSERAEFRLGMMAKERARLDFEEQLLRSEIAIAARKRGAK